MTNGACIMALLESMPSRLHVFVLKPWEFML